MPEDAPLTEGLADQLGELLKLVDGSDVLELEVEHEGTRFIVRREVANPRAGGYASEPQRSAPVSAHADEFVITAPLVGVFRRSSGGSGESALEEGDAVMAGQVVGAVEAMGMLNRVQSERAGTVQELLVREGQPVEYGQPLLVIKSGQ